MSYPTAPPAYGPQSVTDAAVPTLYPDIRNSGLVPTMSHSKVELKMTCKKLLDRDLTSDSDPFCAVFLNDSRTSNQWIEIGRTETIKDDRNPKWTTGIITEYYFEEKQLVRFDVYDSDSKSSQLNRHDSLGTMECSIGNIVAATREAQSFERPLVHGGDGRITVWAEEIQANSMDEVELQFTAEGLDKKDFLGKSDPYLVISKEISPESFVPVFKTEVVKHTLSPRWKTFFIPLHTLCSADPTRPLKFECYDWDSDSDPDFIGSFMTTMDKLSQGPGENNVYECINPKKRKKKNYKNSGRVFLQLFRMHKMYSFLDFCTGGLELHFSVAVDFTASNGDPNSPQSLHFRNQYGGENQYTGAIRAVCDIVQDYDTDKLFPAFGFGARIPPQFLVSHEFFLNGSPDNPYCSGMEGVLQAYYHSLMTVRLYGPTNFAPVIRHVMSIAKTFHDGNHYFILLVITDGLISDMEDTKSAIVDSSYYPMSLIIVGVGNEDFSDMDILDADDRKLSFAGRKADRDIVQFVEVRKFVSPHDGTLNRALLAREVLAEIPGQVVEYMKKKGFTPGRLQEQTM